MESIPIGDDSSHFLSVGPVDEIDLGELAQGGEVLEEIVVAQGLDVGGIVVHITMEGKGGGSWGKV